MELSRRAREEESWPALRSFALERFPKAGVTFADVHNAIVFAITGDHESSARRGAELRAGRNAEAQALLARRTDRHPSVPVAGMN
jgi:hypothetical protein